VSPYLDDIQAKILANFATEGFECVAERHLRDKGNFSFAEVSEPAIAAMIREVAAAKPEAIAVFCTNMRGGPIAAALEEETGIPVYDTVATAVWAGLRLVGESPSRVRGWGRLFAEIA
jgi:maleate isomerase